MSFTWFADKPLRIREQIMECIVKAADDLDMPDKRGACIIAGMTVAQEAGADSNDPDTVPEWWCPSNPTNDPETDQYEHDSNSNDSRSSGYFQQQPPWWGTAAQRMDCYESARMFLTSLKRYPYRAPNAQEANNWAQKVQGSSFPNAYAKWWQLANDVYDNVIRSQSPPASPPAAPAVLSDPFTGAMWSPNRYHPRTQGTPRWIAIHTQEGGRTAVDLAAFLDNPSSQVSYHVVVDDHDILKVVAESDSPWAASNANGYAFHICLAGSYAAWSAGKWLETDASDGKNEDQELTNAAKVVAWWCRKYDIPAEWIGGNGIPWGRDGICGHIDFGAWGGGHHDPGPNFPWAEFIRRVKAFLAGDAPSTLPPVPPIGPGGGTPVVPDTSKYFTGLLYIGSEGPQVTELQRRLKAAYKAYAGNLPVDGDFGPLTDAAVREFQRRSGLMVDGIVGPQTAAALKLRKV